MVVTPTHAEDVCVSFFSRDPKLRIADGLSEFPEVAEHLKSAYGATPEQGSLVGLTSTWRVASAHVALVGDASCSVDGIAGHGLSLGIAAGMRAWRCAFTRRSAFLSLGTPQNRKHALTHDSIVVAHGCQYLGPAQDPAALRKPARIVRQNYFCSHR